MKLAEALGLISSDQPHDRLRGGRALQKLGRASDIPEIQKALAKESVLWVKRALVLAVSAIEKQQTQNAHIETSESIVDDTTIRDIFLKASEEILSILLHEVQPKLGYIRAAALREIPNFVNSETRKKIDYLDELLVLLSDLRKVSQTPKFSTFDLANLVDDVQAEFETANIQLAGARPLVVVGEESRIRLAIVNGVRNALDANSAVGDTTDRYVTIAWGSDDDRYWISVIDQGIGIHGNINGMFAIGQTSKRDHFGMGLPIARQAMLALGGDVKLGPGAQGGARFEVDWDKVPTPSQEAAQ